MVSLIHFFADSFVVVSHQSVADVEHTVFLLDHEFCAEIVFSGDVALHLVEGLHSGVAESLHPESLGHAFTGFAAAVVGGVGELMFHAGVYEHEAVAFRVEGEILIFHRAAVEAHKVSLAAEYGSELVHDSAVHAAIVVLGALSDFCELEFVDFVAVEKVVEGECEARFESSAGAETCA